MRTATCATALSAKKGLPPSHKKLGAQITGDELFYYIYGVLHLPAYRSRFATNLQKEIPRIPVPNRLEDFHALSQAGQKLGELHGNYDHVDPWQIEFEAGGWDPADGLSQEEWFRVNKPMKHPGRARNKDLARIIYNDHITVANIPQKALDYEVNGKPAVAWVMERQCVTTHKASGIVNDANRYAMETMGDPAFPLKLLARVIRVSIETQNIINTLPEPAWQE